MASVRDRLLTPLARLRAIADSPMGLRQYRVFIRRETTSDGRGGRGATVTRTDTELTERPRITTAGQQDVVTSGGTVQIGDFYMDRITPQNEAGTVGTAPRFLDPSPGAADEKVFIVLVGPGMPSGGGEFTVVYSEESKNFGFRYILRPRTGRR